MAITLQELLVKISADISEYSSGIQEAVSEASKLGSAFDGIGGALSAGLTAPLAAIGAAAMDAASEFKEAMNVIVVNTGAAGNQLESLKGSFSTVFADVPASAKEVGTAIADISRSLGLTGEPLEQLTKQLLDLANITGQEVGPLVSSTTQLFKQWQVATADQSQTLEYLFSVFQHTGASVQELASGLTEFGASFRNMGLDLKQSAAFLGELSKEGVPAAQAMTGLRKAMSEMAKAGLDTSHGFQDVVSWIKAAGTEAEGLQRSIQVFGAKGGGTLFSALKAGALDLQNLTAQFSNANRSISETERTTQTLGESMVESWHKVLVAVQPIGQIINSTMRSAFEGIADAVTPVLASISKAFTALPEFSQKVVVGLGAIAAAAGPAMLAISKGLPLAISGLSSLAGVLAPLPGLMVTFGKAALDAWVSWPSRIPSATGAVASLVNVLKGLPSLFVNIASAAASAFANLPATLASIATAVQSVVVGAFTALAASITNIAFAVSNNLVGALSTGEKLLLGFGQAALVAAAAFAGWELGSWLYKNVPLLQQFGDGIANLIAKIPGVEALISKMAGLSAVQAQTPALVSALESRLKAKGVQVQRAAGMSDQDYQKYLNQLAASYQPPAGSGVSAAAAANKAGASSSAVNSKLTAIFGADALKKAEEEAKKFADALETVGVAAAHTEKLQSSMQLVTAAFVKGKVSVDQYGMAVSGMLEKELAAAEKLAGQTITGNLDKAGVIEFRDALAQVDKEFAKGQIGVDEYVDRLRSLQAQMAAASGTSLEVGMKGLGLPTDKQLADAANAAQHYFSMVENSGKASAAELSRAWQKSFDALTNIDPRLSSLKALHIIPIEQLQHDSDEAAQYFGVIANSAKSTFGEAFQAAEAAWKSFFAVMQSSDPRLASLKAAGIISHEELAHEAALAAVEFENIRNSWSATAGEIVAISEKTWKAAFDFKSNVDPLLVGLKGLGITSSTELQHAADQSRVYFQMVASSGRATASQLQQAFQAMVDANRKAAEAHDPGAAAMRALGIPTQADLETALTNANRMLSDLQHSATATAQGIKVAMDKVFQAQYNLKAAQTPSLNALQQLGIPSDEELSHAEGEIKQYYDAVAGDSSSSLREISEAWQKWFALFEQTSDRAQALKILNLPTQEELDHAMQMVTAAYAKTEQLAEANQVSQFQLAQARLSELQQQVKIGQQEGIQETLSQSKEIYELTVKLAQTNRDIWADVHKEIGGAIDQLDTGLAKALLDFHNFGKDIENTLKTVFSDVFTNIFKALTKPLTDWLTKSLTDAISPVVNGITKVLYSSFSGVSKAVSGLQSLAPAAAESPITAAQNAAVNATMGVTNAAQTTAQAAASSASSAAGSLANIANIANIAGAAINLISGIVNAAQMARQENSLNAIEHNTRYLQIESEKYFQQDEWDRHYGLLAKFDAIIDRLADIWNAMLGVGNAAKGVNQTAPEPTETPAPTPTEPPPTPTYTPTETPSGSSDIANLNDSVSSLADAVTEQTAVDQTQPAANVSSLGPDLDEMARQQAQINQDLADAATYAQEHPAIPQSLGPDLTALVANQKKWQDDQTAMMQDLLAQFPDAVHGIYDAAGNLISVASNPSGLGPTVAPTQDQIVRDYFNHFPATNWQGSSEWTPSTITYTQVPQMIPSAATATPAGRTTPNINVSNNVFRGPEDIDYMMNLIKNQIL